MKLQKHYHCTFSLVLIRTSEQHVNSQLSLPLDAVSTEKVDTKVTQTYHKTQIGKQL